MAHPIDWISTDPGGKPVTVARLSISQFNNKGREYLSFIEEVKLELERICQPFNAKGTILPITCKEAVSTLSQLEDHVDKFCELLDETARLPLIFTALRHELLLRLCLIKEQIRALEDLIDSYRVVCMSSSTNSQRKRIYSAFQNIFQQISYTSQELKFQSEAARFQEQRLMSIFEGESNFSQ
jgi:hypothetical protein